MLAWLATAPSVHAQCAGFADFTPGGFCGNVAWIKNRAITLGCGDGTIYFPIDPVSRPQMAAFMYRLGKALSANLLYDQASGPTLDLVAPPATVCATPHIPVATYERIAHLAAVMSAMSVGTSTLRLTFVYSENGGATWWPLHGASTGSATGAWINVTAWRGGAILIGPGEPMRLGLRADSGAGGATITDWACQLEVALFSTEGVN